MLENKIKSNCNCTFYIACYAMHLCTAIDTARSLALQRAQHYAHGKHKLVRSKKTPPTQLRTGQIMTDPSTRGAPLRNANFSSIASCRSASSTILISPPLASSFAEETNHSSKRIWRVHWKAPSIGRFVHAVGRSPLQAVACALSSPHTPPHRTIETKHGGKSLESQVGSHLGWTGCTATNTHNCVRQLQLTCYVAGRRFVHKIDIVLLECNVTFFFGHQSVPSLREKLQGATPSVISSETFRRKHHSFPLLTLTLTLTLSITHSSSQLY